MSLKNNTVICIILFFHELIFYVHARVCILMKKDLHMLLYNISNALVSVVLWCHQSVSFLHHVHLLCRGYVAWASVYSLINVGYIIQPYVVIGDVTSCNWIGKSSVLNDCPLILHIISTSCVEGSSPACRVSNFSSSVKLTFIFSCNSILSLSIMMERTSSSS